MLRNGGVFIFGRGGAAKAVWAEEKGALTPPAGALRPQAKGAQIPQLVPSEGADGLTETSPASMEQLGSSLARA